ncbi:MAG: FecR domain-containing protein [Alistipes sp.]|nr:FecR domain-containing protein [Alistipes sp.]
MTLNETLLLKYLQGECNEKENTLIRQWLDQGEGNRKLLFNLELSLQRPEKKVFGKEESLRRAESRLIASIDRYENKVKTERAKLRARRRRLNWLTSAAAVVIIAAGIYLLDTFTEPARIVVAASDIDPIKKVILPDGSKVWLNRGGKLTYSEKFGKTDRELHLDGEAYFHVAHNEALPFVVSSPVLHTTALGTQFNMHSYGHKDLAHVSLIEGAVQVKGMNGEGQIVLSPSQRAELDLSSKRMTVKTVNTKLDAVWHNNLIPFTDASIYDIAQTLEQLYNVNFLFDDDLHIPGSYAGAIQQKDGIEDVLGSLMNSIPFAYSINGNTIRISNR